MLVFSAHGRGAVERPWALTWLWRMWGAGIGSHSARMRTAVQSPAGVSCGRHMTRPPMGAEPGDPAGQSPWGQECRGSLDLVDTARSDGLGIRTPQNTSPDLALQVTCDILWEKWWPAGRDRRCWLSV